MKKLNYILYLILIIYLGSCTTRIQKTNQKEESLKILIAKTTETVDGSVLGESYIKYLLAFNDGYTVITSFGIYECLQIGDTVRFTKDKGTSDFWLEMKPNCK